MLSVLNFYLRNLILLSVEKEKIGAAAGISAMQENGFGSNVYRFVRSLKIIYNTNVSIAIKFRNLKKSDLI